MSLVSNEGEGEQNEIRILQDKLNSTMKLVSHLTAQLNELKEQVCTPAPSWYHPRGPTLGSLRLSQPSLPLGGGVGVGPSLKCPPFLPGLSLALGWKTGPKHILPSVES